MKSLNPIGRGKVCLKKEGANDIIESAKNTLSFTILLRGIGQDMRRWTPWVRKKARVDELSNSRPLSHCMLLMVQPN